MKIREKSLDEYLNSRQICYKREVDMDVRQWLENYFAKEKRAAEIHDEMCANTNTVQAKFIAALEDNIEKLGDCEVRFLHKHSFLAEIIVSGGV
ncbi:MAG: hypothetical protein ACLUD0_06690 [Eubacterium ramulus]